MSPLSLNNVRSLRLQHTPAWSQEELARHVHCCVATLGRIERGERCPTLPLAFRIAEALGRPVEDVFWGIRDDCLRSLARGLHPDPEIPEAAPETAPGPTTTPREPGLPDDDEEPSVCLVEDDTSTAG